MLIFIGFIDEVMAKFRRYISMILEFLRTFSTVKVGSISWRRMEDIFL